MKRNLKIYLNDILDSIKKIESFSEKLTKEKLFSDDLHQSAIIRQLEVIGEAAKNIPNGFREKYLHVPWKDISGFRDVMIHGYFRVDLDRVWRVIKEDLPDLKKKILKIKMDLGNKNG